jgi:hypothetical protein
MVNIPEQAPETPIMQTIHLSSFGGDGSYSLLNHLLSLRRTIHLTRNLQVTFTLAKPFFSQGYSYLPHTRSSPFTETDCPHDLHSLRLVPRHHPQPNVLRLLRLPYSREAWSTTLLGAWQATGVSVIASTYER